MMKRILINEKNLQKISEAIKAAEGRATARLLDTDTISRLIDRAENALPDRGVYGRIPKNRMDGTKIYFDGGQQFPNAYKYRPESTHCTIENHSGKWYLTDVRRDTCPNRQTSGEILYSDAAKAWILEQVATI